MDARSEKEAAPVKIRASVVRKSDREVVVTRVVNGPARLVFQAWTTAELFQRWWIPKSIGINLVSCEMDVRVGGGYRLEFGVPGSTETKPFFGKYTEVKPHTRLVWTNEEGGEVNVTTVTFEEQGGKTLVTLHELYPSKEALEAGVGAYDAIDETLDQLNEVLATLRAPA
jgi:uncharacterized protein YndB with AHSA1/START domain